MRRQHSEIRAVSRPMDDLDHDACVRCLQPKAREDLDRMLWCDACGEAARKRAASQGWVVGLVAATILALWIWLFVQPSNLVIGGWIGTVVGAFYVTARVAREILHASARIRSRPAAGAVPPERYSS